MARIYARRKGRSGSSALPRSEHPAWAPEPKEVEELVGKLSKEGLSTAEIGLQLRDSHGIPSVKLATGKAVAAMVRDPALALSIIPISEPPRPRRASYAVFCLKKKKTPNPRY